MNNKTPNWETHWFQLRENTLLKLKGTLLTNLIKRSIKKAGNLNKLTKEINLSYPSFSYALNKKSLFVSVKKLKKLADYLEINYNYFNNKIIETKKGEKISIENPKFPFNLKTKQGAYLLGFIVSDGTIYKDKKARNVCRTKYSSNDQESIDKFIKAIETVFGKVHIQREFIRKNTYLRIGTSIIADSLLKVGAPLGNKTKNNNYIPWLIRDNQNLRKYYLKAVFTDEGSSYGNKKYNPYISLTRYNRINNLLTEKEIDKLNNVVEPLMKENIFPTGHITKSISFPKIKNKISKNIYNKLIKEGISNLLLDESKLLNEMGIKTNIHITRLSKTPLGFFSLVSTLVICRKQSVLKFYKEVGFLLSRKQNKLENSLMEVNWINEPKIVQHIN